MVFFFVFINRNNQHHESKSKKPKTNRLFIEYNVYTNVQLMDVVGFYHFFVGAVVFVCCARNIRGTVA